MIDARLHQPWFERAADHATQPCATPKTAQVKVPSSAPRTSKMVKTTPSCRKILDPPFGFGRALARGLAGDTLGLRLHAGKRDALVIPGQMIMDPEGQFVPSIGGVHHIVDWGIVRARLSSEKNWRLRFWVSLARLG